MSNDMTRENLERALFAAAGAGRASEVEELLGQGVAVDVVIVDGYQPLHYAAVMGRKEVVGLLVARGAKVDAADRHRWRPLHYAASGKHRGVVTFLLGHGANPVALNKDGKTPGDLCKNAEIRTLLKKAERTWREREALAAHRRRQRWLGSLRPKVPTL